MASVRKRKWTHKGVEREAWVVAYTDQSGKRRIKTFDKKADAVKHRAEVEVELEQGTHVSAIKHGTIRTVGELFVKQAEARFRDGQIGWNRVREIKQHIDVRIVPILGGVVFANISHNDVERLYETLIRERGNSASTAKKTVKDLALLEDFAIKRGYAKKQAVRKAIVDLRGVRKKVVATFTPDQVRAIFNYIESSRPGQGERERLRNRLFIYLAGALGLRYGEIAALSPESINFDQGTLTVSRSILLNGETKPPKSEAGNRCLPVPQIILAMLLEWRRRFFVANESDLLFTTYNGEWIKHANFWRTWVSILKGSGVGERAKNGDRYHFHALRHFAASMMVSNNLPITDVAQMLGHSKVDMTLRVYAHPLKQIEARRETVNVALSSLVDATTEQQRLLTN